MPTNYTVKQGDTLASIAEKKLGSRSKSRVLADYNALRSRRKLPVGARIQIPSVAELRPRVVPLPRSAAWPAPPQGLQAVLATFGNIYEFIKDDGSIDPRWETQNIARVALPAPIPLDWDTSKSATSIRCHRLLVPLYTEVFRRVSAAGLASTIQTYGGCYTYRAKRNGSKPSTHSWGIAIDFNVRTNAMGTAGNMDPRLVALMEGLGFVWGGRWSGPNKDPMHFQFCSGY
jgi:LysM repeat protein